MYLNDLINFFSLTYTKNEYQNVLRNGHLYYGSVFANSDVLNTQIHDIAEKTTQSIGIGLPKNSELKELFDYHLRKMHQSGLTDQFYNIWIHKRKPSDNAEDEFDDAFALGFNNLTLVFIILFSGVIAGIFLCTFELLFRCPKYL